MHTPKKKSVSSLVSIFFPIKTAYARKFEEQPMAVAPSRMRGVLAGIAWMLAIGAFLVAISIACMSGKPKNTAAPAESTLHQPEIAPAPNEIPKPRFSRHAMPGLREAE